MDSKRTLTYSLIRLSHLDLGQYIILLRANRNCDVLSTTTKKRSTKQIPNYLEQQKALRKEGIKKVIVYCVVSAES
jgi:hypothetical protein